MILLIAMLALFTANAQAKGEGTVVIEARDALTHAPLQGVQVMIRGVGGILFNGATGPDGIVRFPEVAASDYTMIYDCPGYAGSADLGDRPILRVGEGGVTVRHTLSLMPDSAIEGLVVDEEGKPFAGVSVQARREGSMVAQQGVTDREGRFRIFKLRPADYRITMRVSDGDRKATLKRDPETGETFGYPDFTYYPSGWDPGAGALVQVPAGARLRGFDVRLRRTRLVEFTGSVLARAGGDPIGGAELDLNAPGPDSPIESYSRITAGTDGRFAFDMLVPGHYELDVYQHGAAKDLPSKVDVEIGKTGVVGMRVLLPPLQSLTGRMKIVPEDPGARARVVVLFLAPGRFRDFTVEGPGEFTLEGIPPGRWKVDIQPQTEPGGPDRKKLGVASLQLGAEDALGGMTVSESGNPPLSLTLTAEMGRIAGRVHKEDAGRTLNVLVHRVGFGGVQMAMVKADGSFAAEDLIPGLYELIAVEEGFLWLVPPKVSPFIRVEVKAGETTVASPPIATQ